MGGKGIFYRLYRKCCYILNRIKLNGAIKENPLNREPRDKQIIVSMTSYPARFPHIHLTLKSIMRQTMKPDKIIVWLDEDVTRSQYTEEMIALEKCGVEYRTARGNLKPHKKYIYAMREYPEDIIITADDDVIYSPNVIKSLMNTHKKYPSAVCARRVHRIIRNQKGKIAPYNKWQGEYMRKKQPSHDLLATGVGGVLYPPHCLDSRAFDMELIKKLCLGADDIWLKIMELLAGTKVVWAPCHIPAPEEIKESQKNNLRSENVRSDKNDVYMQDVLAYFHINENCFWKS